jgi:ABC-2 type transport system permease protein
VPIFDQGYRRYEARGPLRRLRFWPITREALKLLAARRAFLLLLGVSWLPFAGRVVQLLVVTRFPEAARVAPIDGRMFGDFLNQQLFWVLLVSTFAGAGLVANDLRTGAILVYLARPLTRRDYVLGKLSVLLILNLAITLVPGLLLYAVGLGLAPERYLERGQAWIAAAVVLQSVAISAAIGILALAISSLARSARVAAVSFFGLVFGLHAVQGILVHVVRAEWASPLSPWANLEALAGRLFDMTSQAHALPAAIALALVASASLLVLRARVRAVEIVR